MNISQNVAVLIDGNNIGMSAHNLYQDKNLMIDFKKYIPKIVGENRSLTKFYYFREGVNISKKFTENLHLMFYGVTVPCYKSADSVLTMTAIQICEKIDTIIIFSGDVDYLHLIRFLKTKGVRIEIAAFKQTTHNLIFKEADFFHEMSREDMFRFVFNPNHQSQYNKEELSNGEIKQQSFSQD